MVAQRLGILVFCPDLLCDWVWKVREGGRGSYKFQGCFFSDGLTLQRWEQKTIFFGRNESCFQIHSPYYVGGGFKHFLFSPLPGEDSHFD